MTSSSRRSTSVAILFGLGIALHSFGAVYKPEALGALAASPSVFFFLPAALLSLSKAHEVDVGRWTILLLIWGIFASITSLIFFPFNDVYFYKSFSMFVLMFFWISPLICYQHFNLKIMKFSFIAVIIIAAFALIVSDFYPVLLPEFLRSFIFSSDYYIYFDARPRGFATETSSFAAHTVRIALLLFLAYEVGKAPSAWRMFSCFIACALFLLFVGSKGAISSIAIVLIIVTLKPKYMLWLLPVIVVLWLLVTFQIDAISTDLTKFTSTSTRSALLYAGSIATLVNPAGWGYYGFYGTVSYFGPILFDDLWRMNLNTWELERIVFDLHSVSYKSSLVDYAVVFGWPFIVFIVACLRKTDLSDIRVRAVAVYLLLSGLSTSSNETITLFIGLGFLMRYYPRRPGGSQRVPKHWLSRT